MTAGQQFGPLSNVKIVDLSMWWSGPLTTQLFALMGAEVIKVESIQRIDGWRLAVRMMADAGHESAHIFNGVNLNKRGITLDLSNEEGRKLLRRLVERADALVENYSPRVMGNLGLTDEVLREWNPNLVILSMPAFGLTGPWRDYVGFAPTIEQLSGLPELTGEQDGPPVLSGHSVADPTAGLTGCLALLAALRRAKATGRGCHVDLSQLEALTFLLGPALLAEQLTGSPPPRYGNSHPSAAPHGVYPCKGDEQWVVLSIRTDSEWASLCSAIGRTDLVSDARFSDGISRWRNRQLLDEAISEWTAERTNIEAAEALQQAGVPAGPVYWPSQLMADTHLRERGYLVELDRDVVGRHPYPGVPFRFSRTPGRVVSPAPTLGQHNQDILQGLLGLSQEEIEALRKAQVIGEQPLD